MIISQSNWNSRNVLDKIAILWKLSQNGRKCIIIISIQVSLWIFTLLVWTTAFTGSSASTSSSASATGFSSAFTSLFLPFLSFLASGSFSSYGSLISGHASCLWGGSGRRFSTLSFRLSFSSFLFVDILWFLIKLLFLWVGSERYETLSFRISFSPCGSLISDHASYLWGG